MDKINDMITASKLHDVLHRKEDSKVKHTILWVLAVIGAVATVAGIAYAVYSYFSERCEIDFDDDYEDEFDDDFLAEDGEI